jgi:hypothetical protein
MNKDAMLLMCLLTAFSLSASEEKKFPSRATGWADPKSPPGLKKTHDHAATPPTCLRPERQRSRAPMGRNDE